MVWICAVFAGCDESLLNLPSVAVHEQDALGHLLICQPLTRAESEPRPAKVGSSLMSSRMDTFSKRIPPAKIAQAYCAKESLATLQTTVLPYESGQPDARGIFWKYGDSGFHLDS